MSKSTEHTWPKNTLKLLAKSHFSFYFILFLLKESVQIKIKKKDSGFLIVALTFKSVSTQVVSSKETLLKELLERNAVS